MWIEFRKNAWSVKLLSYQKEILYKNFNTLIQKWKQFFYSQIYPTIRGNYYYFFNLNVEENHKINEINHILLPRYKG